MRPIMRPLNHAANAITLKTYERVPSVTAG